MKKYYKKYRKLKKTLDLIANWRAAVDQMD